MSVLSFEGYHVEEMNYQRNSSYKAAQKTILMDPKFSKDVSVEGNKIDVRLSVTVGSFKNTETPFYVKCSVTGTFVYHPDENETKAEVDTLIRNNAVAILYPYVRAIVATLTTASNEFPGYNMPTINVSQVLADNKDD